MSTIVSNETTFTPSPKVDTLVQGHKRELKVASNVDNQSLTDCSADESSATEFHLSDFFPYNTRVFYKHVSQAVARVYIEEYGMKPYEWRTLAMLGTSNSFTAADLVASTSMDKISISRAVASLTERGWLVSRSNENDGRSRILSTSDEGKRVLSHLVPKMKAVEQDILSVLSQDEARELQRLMRKVVDGA